MIDAKVLSVKVVCVCATCCWGHSQGELVHVLGGKDPTPWCRSTSGVSTKEFTAIHFAFPVPTWTPIFQLGHFLDHMAVS